MVFDFISVALNDLTTLEGLFENFSSDNFFAELS